ncbi:SIS domain-containing protein [Paraburkholderia silvatlantica]|uniref:RpiR family transcriptional regulator n=1 Tax=Paraburkholderia silvatlantica TaxID=321895 RepID=A0A2U1ACC3_9BURK|nr:SIS domain-containing protein [Paraburkholderia silvatlantica]MBB2925731.1 DNA-binding MurR/RpiR family transcriptional regulator [Paraburkholderia silvatlantica]PVY33153.1 RpiR family transcriptional regulator [Paraburkholderia silvatlantica]PXW38045.1 RpiR family transcriptional regulator [Paraburkholderia silvatlantica]PYE28021.1 RpiR family transcriptional regulator [Paraburkholderia silvatlantica]TDQ92574.1 RpiR family transcriptional regulator [Paraburkholderia silvatlantica]
MPDYNILEVIDRARPNLRRGSRQVADYILANVHTIADLSLSELARLAQVSEPTVLRFCATIGCSGFKEFKIRAVQSLALGAPATHSVLSGADTPETVATKIFDYTITSLDWARKKLDFEAIGRAVDLLAVAQRIEFFGFGASGIVALDAQQKFPLFGVPCIAHQDSHQQFIAASMLKPGDAVVAISNTGSTRSLIEVARTAKERGASVVVITGSRGPLTRYCDVAVVAETLENTDVYTPTTSRLAALVIVDILSTSVALKKGEAHALDVQDMKRHLADMRSSGVI